MNNPVDIDLDFITENGGLNVHLKPDEVTWFDFLYFSRLTNSLEGGWKGKSHWRKRGVQKLAASNATYVTQWTKNSLQTKALPLPRADKFKFDRSLSSRAHLEQSLKLRKSLNESLNEFTEHELNYALYVGGLGIKRLDKIRLIGFEIPLTAESEGQLKIDLIGVSLGNDAIEIVELKKANNSADSPLMALTEAICYALQTLKCKKSLLNEAKLAGREEAFKKINLTLLAPRKYWIDWGVEENSFSENLNKLSEELQPILNRVNEGIPDSELKLQLLELKLAEPGTAQHA